MKTDELEAIRKEIRRATSATLSFAALADYLGFSKNTVYRMAKQPGFPLRKALQTDENGNSVKVFLRTDIDQWLKSAPISRAS